MKKLFSFLTLAMVFAFASCMKEEVDLGGGNEEMVRISVNLPQQEALSRAAFTDPSLNQDMRVFLYVMYEGKIVSTVEKERHNFENDGAFTWDIRLVTGKDYTVAVWADFGVGTEKYYVVRTEEVNEKIIPTVEMVTNEGKINGSNNARDAYFAVKTVNFKSANASESMTLKRPFGLVRIQTLDHKEGAVVNAGLLPTDYEMTVAAQTKMNLFSGELMGNDNSLTISGEVTDVATSGELSFDYFFAPVEVEGNAEEQQGKLHNFTVKYTKDGNEIVSYDFTNIPVRRNYKTNISGNILTKKGTINVTVDQNWDGVRLVGNEIYSVEDLIGFATAVNAGETYSGETIYLMTDVDLTGVNWTPVGNMKGANKFMGTFDGNGHVISNLTIEGRDMTEAGGLFGVLNGTVKNLVVDGATVKHIVDGNNGGVAVVAGSIYTNGLIENVIVKNATVESNRWTGGIVGYMYGSVKNCMVENITLTATPDDLSGHYDNGDKVGGIVGYSAADNHGVISGNMAKNVTIKGYRDLGGIAGAANAVSLTDNSAENITIKVDQRTGYYGMETANTGVVMGRNLDGKTLDGTNISSGDIAISYVYFVENGTNLGQLKIASNSTYYIEAGEYASFGLYTQGKENIALIADGEVIVNGKLTFGTHSNYTRSIPESNLIEGFTVKGELFLSACGKFVVRNNKAAQITMKTFGLTEDPSYTSDIEFIGNTVDGTLAEKTPQSYGIYLVPNVTGYKLNVTGNTIKNVGSHAFVIQGSGDGSAKTTPGAYTIAENHFESWGLANGDNRGAVKVWADTAIAPESMEGGTVSDLSEAARTFVNSVLSGNNVFPDPLRENCVIFEFYGLPFNSLE